MHWTDIGVRERDGIVIVEPCGQLTLAHDEERRLMPLVRRMLESGHRQFLVNLGQLAQIDSTGVGELVGIYTRVARHGGHLHLCEVRPRVAEILRATHLDDVLRSLGSEAESVVRLSCR
jgi:anti-anti-sigma factor